MHHIDRVATGPKGVAANRVRALWEGQDKQHREEAEQDDAGLFVQIGVKNAGGQTDREQERRDDTRGDQRAAPGTE